MAAQSAEAGSYTSFKLAMTALALLSLLFSVWLFLNERNHVFQGYGDFIIFYTGAEIVGAGLADNLYDPALQRAYQNKFDVPIREGPLLFNHAPFELLFFLPLSYFPYPLAYIAWSLINLLLLAGCVRLLLPFLDKQHLGMVCILMLGFFPVFVTVLYGQDSILSMFLITAAFARLKKRQEGAAGALLSLGLFKPQLVLPIIGVLLLKKRWAAIKGFSLGAVFFVGVSIGLVGIEGANQFIKLLLRMNQTHYTIAPANMPNLRGFLESFLLTQSPGLAFVAILILSSGLFVIMAFLWRGEYQPETSLFDLKFSLSALVLLMTSYHLYLHDLSLLSLPAVLTLNCLLRGPANAERIIFLFLLVLLWFPFPLTYLPLLRYELMSLAFVIVAALSVVLVIEIRRQQRQVLTAGEQNCLLTNTGLLR